MSKKRALEYAFQMNVSDYLFVVSTETQTDPKPRDPTQWIGQGSYEVYAGQAHDLWKLETNIVSRNNENAGLSIRFYTGSAVLRFPPIEFTPREQAFTDFMLTSNGNFNSFETGNKFKKPLTRLDLASLPKDVFDLLNVPAPTPTVFALRKQ